MEDDFIVFSDDVMINKWRNVKFPTEETIDSLWEDLYLQDYTTSVFDTIFVDLVMRYIKPAKEIKPLRYLNITDRLSRDSIVVSSAYAKLTEAMYEEIKTPLVRNLYNKYNV